MSCMFNGYSLRVLFHINCVFWLYYGMSVHTKCNMGTQHITHSMVMKSQVRMVTGDNLQTAKAIALECGILASIEDAVEPNIIEGKKFRELSEKEREDIAKKITVCFFLCDFFFFFLVDSHFFWWKL